MRTGHPDPARSTPTILCVKLKPDRQILSERYRFTMTEEVQIISAVWCKRCVTIKPEIQLLCSMNNIACSVVDFDEDLDENDELKAAITSLPTILYRTSATAVWEVYTAATLGTWKAKMAEKTAKDAVPRVDLDF